MSFKNEKIPDQDRKRLSSIITFEKISAIAHGVPKFSDPSRWTIDHDRDTYLISLVGGGREQLPYYVFGIGDQVVVFNEDDKSKGDDTVGNKVHLEVHDLRIPSSLESRREEIKQLISEGLEENQYFKPFADGGTVNNPNTTTRRNIISFNIEFK